MLTPPGDVRARFADRKASACLEYRGPHVLFLPFMIYLVLLGRRVAASPGLFPGAMFLMLGVACFAYGSFLVLFRLLLQRPVARATLSANSGNELPSIQGSR